MIELVENLELVNKLRNIVKTHNGWLELRYQRRKINSFLVKKGRIDSSTASFKQGVGVRVLKNGTWGFASTSNLDESEILKTIKQAVTSAELTGSNKNKRRVTLHKTNLSQGVFTPEVNSYLEFIPVSEKINFLLKSEEYMRKLSKNIISTTCKYTEIIDYKIIISSDGADLIIYDSKPEINFVAVVGKNGTSSVSTKACGLTGGWDDLFSRVDPEKWAEKVVKKASDLNKAKHVDGGTYDVILAPDLVGLLAHEAIGHTVEADFVLAGSVAKNLLNKKVASSLVTLIDTGESLFKPHAGGELLVDDEGVKTKPVYIIKNGILKSYLHNRQSAKKFNVEPTGNARAYNYSNEPIIRMRNTCIAPGKSKLKDMISSIDNGFFLTGGGSGQADSNAEFMFGVDEIYQIKKGKLGKLFKGATISGQAFDVLKSITAVSDDFKWDLGSGYCGKGQMAKVDAGGPYVKCKMTIGGR
ncbi:TldD/PmbA family protein [Candidatus Dependentiae bacterium]|nr:TldD/PmbA family protein [Candidatus Dependentiae bacterium]